MYIVFPSLQTHADEYKLFMVGFFLSAQKVKGEKMGKGNFLSLGGQIQIFVGPSDRYGKVELKTMKIEF